MKTRYSGLVCVPRWPWQRTGTNSYGLTPNKICLSHLGHSWAAENHPWWKLLYNKASWRRERSWGLLGTFLILKALGMDVMNEICDCASYMDSVAIVWSFKSTTTELFTEENDFYAGSMDSVPIIIIFFNGSIKTKIQKQTIWHFKSLGITSETKASVAKRLQTLAATAGILVHTHEPWNRFFIVCLLRYLLWCLR